MIVNYDRKTFIVQATEANAIKLFTMPIYCHSMVLLSFCVIKHYYLSNYHRMAVEYHGKSFMTVVVNLNTVVICHGILTLENVGSAVNYSGIFITLASSVNITKLLAL